MERFFTFFYKIFGQFKKKQYLCTRFRKEVYSDNSCLWFRTSARKDGWVAETNSLLNCRTGNRTGGSNPPPSAKEKEDATMNMTRPLFFDRPKGLLDRTKVLLNSESQSSNSKAILT